MISCILTKNRNKYVRPVVNLHSKKKITNIIDISIHLFNAVYLPLFKNNKTLFLGHRLYDVDLYLFY